MTQTVILRNSINKIFEQRLSAILVLANLDMNYARSSSYFTKLTQIAVSISLALLLNPLAAHASSIAYLEENADTYIEETYREYGEMIDIAALLHDYDEAMILAVIVVESEGNTNAVSSKGAKGLMQLMPLTARSLGVHDVHEPLQNILGGTKYLKELEDRYGFRSKEEALVAYNMGPARAKRWLSQYEPEEFLYVRKVKLVYDRILEEQRRLSDIAQATPREILLDSDNDPLASIRPILLKPRNLSLSSFPMTIPGSRRSQFED
jgi:soluble lytic murein transglycosylase-like protein